MLTKKDFIALAAIFKAERDLLAPSTVPNQRSETYRRGGLNTLENIAGDFIRYNKSNNPAFDVAKFKRAAGIEDL